MNVALANLYLTGAVVCACNAIGYTIAAALETHKVTELFGVGSFVVATLSLIQRSGVQVQLSQFPKLALVNWGVILWGTRLASFMTLRAFHIGEPKTPNKVFRKPGEAYFDLKRSFFPIRLGLYWAIQTMWAFLCLLPIALMNAGPSAGPAAAATLAWESSSIVAALSKWAPVVGIYVGVLIETIADAQKNAYRNDKRNDGHWCDRGLWKLSRHPNYFGELLTWWSVYFAALPTLRAATPSSMNPNAPVVALVSPLFITYLLFKVSGIPVLEGRYATQYAGNKEFERYQRETPLLIPNPLLAFRSTAKEE